MKDKNARYDYRKTRTRTKLRKAANGLPRLSVHRSLKAFYAQVIDDVNGKTLVSVASTAKEVRGDRKSSKNTEDAKKVGKLIAEKALKAGIEKVVFDRGAMLYHGRVKALAEAAREAGLKF